MADSITVKPSTPTKGESFEIEVRSSLGDISDVRISRTDGDDPPPFAAKVKSVGPGEWRGKALLPNVGTYKLEAGDTSSVIQVSMTAPTSVTDDMAIYGGIAAILIVGVFFWNRMRGTE